MNPHSTHAAAELSANDGLPPKSSVQTYGKVTWTDIENLENDQIRQLAEKFGVHELQLEECLQSRQLTQLEVEKKYIFIILHFPYYKNVKNQILTDRVGIFLGKDFLLTIHTDKTDTIKDIFEKFELAYSNKPQTSGFMLYFLISELLKYLMSHVQDAQYEIDSVEDSVFTDTESDAMKIGQLRQKIIRLLRITTLQNPVLNELADQIDEFSGDELVRLYKQNAKFGHKLHGNIEEAKETVEIYKDADFITSAEKTNKILTVLTIIFTFSIPATVLGAFFGMNVNLPGGIQTGTWEFLGTYTTLIIIAVVSLLPAMLMYFYFKKKHWL